MSDVHGIGDRNGMGAERSGLIVLGMHRSGTSAITGMLQLCGAWAGEDEELTAANIENPQGFWERRDVRKICDELLHAARADWWKVVGLDLETIPHAILSEQRHRFQSVLSELEEHRPWVVKEPRLCLLLPILRDFLNQVVCVHVFRNPLEVARSLQLRNGFSIAAGMALWETYNRRALDLSRTMPRVMIEYGTLVRDPETAIDRLLRQLKELGVTSLAVPNESMFRQFIQTKYYRHRTTEDDTDRYLSPDQRSLWQQIRSGDVLALNPEGKIVSSVAKQSLYDLESSQRSLIHHKDRITKLNERLIGRETELASLRKVGDGYREEMMTRDAELANLREVIDADRKERANLQAELASMKAELASHRKEIDVRDRKIASLKDALQKSIRDVAARTRKIDQLRNCTSWRLTAPLRLLSRAVMRVTRAILCLFTPARRAATLSPNQTKDS